MIYRTTRALLLMSVVFYFGPVQAFGRPIYFNIYIFGDSFSDTGNVYAGTFGLYPPAPYFQGRFSDGPVMVEQLADRLGLMVVANGANPAVIQGNNFAVGGSEAANDVVFVYPPFNPVLPSLKSQVDFFIAGGPSPLSGEDLYVLFSGNNDLRAAADPANGLSAAERDQVVQDAVNAMADSMTNLAAAGAHDFVVPNIGNLGATPEAVVVRNNAAASTSITRQFNSLLRPRLRALATQLGISVQVFDLFASGQRIIADARTNGGATYGITNVDVPIFPGYAGSPGADPATSLFADDLHASSKAHGMFGDQVYDLITNPALDISANSPLSVGGRLDVSVTVTIPKLTVLETSSVDIYFGVLLPDSDTIIYFTDFFFTAALGSASDVSTLAPIVSDLVLNDSFTYYSPRFFSHVRAGSDPKGVYTLFIAVVEPGSFDDGTIDAGDILALDAANVLFRP